MPVFRHILLATDGSSASDRAAELAVELARSVGAAVTAVYVVDPYPYIGIGDTNPIGVYAYLATARDHAAQAHATVIQLCSAREPRVPLNLRLVENATAAKGIVRTAADEGCDLIVAGTHGRSGFEQLVLGSVVAKLLAASPVPVLVTS